MEVLLCVALAAAFSAAFLGFSHARGYTLYYGDAAAHVNIARRIFDSRTPGYEQLGTVWLPLPHVLMALLVRDDRLWISGLGGAIPGALFFVAGMGFFYAAVRRATGSRAGSIAAAACLGLNPNLLYLQSTPMTEPMFLGCLAAAIYFLVRFHASPRLRYAAGAGAAILAGTLTRYEAWFLLPFLVLFFPVVRSWKAALLFVVIAGAGPAYWLGHNAYFYSDPLEFYRGPHSAMAIYERGLARGYARHPGDHDWATTWQYYRRAMELTMGQPLVWLGAAGMIAAAARRSTRPLMLLAVPVPFYLASIHSGGTPVFVPPLFPYSYYNTRYALAGLPACAAAAGVLISVAPRGGIRVISTLATVAICLGGWAIRPSHENWICWKESEVNSQGRRAWTAQAAEFFRRAWRPGDGIFTASGDVLAVYQAAGIPLRETLHGGNGPAYLGAVKRPDLFFRERWAVALAGDEVSFQFTNPRRYGHVARRAAAFTADREPVIEIYENTLHQGPWGGK